MFIEGHAVVRQIARFWLPVIIIGFLMGADVLAARSALAQAPGGFLETSSSTAVRPRPTVAQIAAFMPAGRGPFTFPAPYNTRGIRITIPSDGDVEYVAYSYWANMNNHVAEPIMYIALNLPNNGGPTLFSLDKATDAVTKIGPLFPSGSELAGSSMSKGWYFSGTRPHALYVMTGDTTLRRYDVLTHAMETVFDVKARADILGANRLIWQAHSSFDDKVHSATLRDSTYKDIGCFVYFEQTGKFMYFPTLGFGYDEAQLDASGRWLVIKEQTKSGIEPGGDNNRVIDLTRATGNRAADLASGAERVILDPDGAGGHSDSGYGYMVAADNYNDRPGAYRLWKFTDTPLVGTLKHFGASWDVENEHASHLNARSDVPAEQQWVFVSGANRINTNRANEVTAFPLDGSLRVLVIAPILTDLDAAGGGSGSDGDYNKDSKGNVDVTGQYFIWTSNMGGNRLDAFIVKVPRVLQAGGGDTTPPSVTITAPATRKRLTGSVTVSATASDDVGVVGVQFKLDGANLGGEVKATPHTMSWNTTRTVDGVHTLTAVARDAAGNTTTSSPRSITVSAGITPPAVSVTAPEAGATLAGKVTVSATASDNVRVVGVQFKLNGANLHAEVTAAPYRVRWNTTRFTPGTHTLTAVARDAAGNSKVSAPVTVTVTAPAPAPGGRVKKCVDEIGRRERCQVE